MAQFDTSGRRSAGWAAGLLSIILGAATTESSAQTFRTIAGGAWSQPLNWGGTVPTNDGTADLVFSTDGNPILLRGSTTLDQDWNIRSILWNAGGLDMGEGEVNASGDPHATLTIQGGVTNASGGALVLYPPIVLGAMQPWHDTASLVPGWRLHQPGTHVYGQISGPGGIRKTGAGTLWLNSSLNTFTGGTIIEGGVVQVNSPGALGTATSTVTLNGGTLRFKQAMIVVESVPQTIVIGENGGTIEGQRAELEFRSLISGPGRLSMRPDSIPNYTENVFSISGANTYEGGTLLNRVHVKVVGSEQALGTGDVTLETGAVLSLTASTNLAPGRKVAMEQGSVLDFAEGQFDPRTLIDADPEKTTGGVLALTAQNHATGIDMAAIGNGKLHLGASGAVTYTSATLGAGSDGVYRLGGGRYVNSASSLTFSGADNVFTGTNSMIIGAKRPESEPYIWNNLALIKNKVEIRNANDFSGGTTLVDGTLLLGNNDALGSGALKISGGEIGAVSGARTIANPVLFEQNSPDLSLVFRSQEPMTFTGPVDLGGSSKRLWGNNAIRTVFQDQITNGSIWLSGGKWAFGGENTFSSLRLSNQAALEVESADNLGSPTGLILMEAGTLVATAGFSFNQDLRVTSAGGAINVQDGEVLFTGRAFGDGPFTKLGNGTLVLKGAKSLGALTVEDGTLRLDNYLFSPPSVAVKGGATLGGNSILGVTTVERGGRIAPGTDLPGILTFKSGLTLKETAVLEFDLGLTLFDQILLTGGTFAKNSGKPVSIDIVDAGGLASGQTYTLIDWSAAAAANGIVPSAFAITESSAPGVLSVVGKTLQYTAVPEPVGLVSLAVGTILLLGRRTRRTGRP